MNHSILMLTTALALSATAARAEIDPQALADAYAAQGYGHIEVTVGPNDVKVEAIQGGTQVEVVYDRDTGSILSQEQGRADDQSGDDDSISIRNSDEDALDDHGDDQAGEDDHGSDGHGSDDAAGDDHGGDDQGGDDNGSDDHGSDDHGGDDHGGDDNGSDDGGSDDHGGDDHGSDD